MEGLNSFLGELAAADSYEVRRKRMALIVRNLHAAALAAIAEEEAWANLKVHHDEAKAGGHEEAHRSVCGRLRALHAARCERMKAVATLARRAMNVAAGDLRIDEETAGTGLMPDERRLIKDVQTGRDGE